MSDYQPSAYGYCDYCFGSSGNHKPGCPNDAEPLPEVAGECEICGEAVFADEDRYCVEGVLYHTECFNDKYMVNA